MLIFPAIFLRQGRSTQAPVGLDGTSIGYPDDPVAAVKMWRSENCKALHIMDLDGMEQGGMQHLELIGEMIRGLDSPVQVCGGIRSAAAARRLLRDFGVYRIVVSTIAFENRALLHALLDEFGPRKIVVGLDVYDGVLYSRNRSSAHGTSPLDFAIQLHAEGIRRILVTNLRGLAEGRCTNTGELTALASGTGLKITTHGYVWSWPDLAAIRDLHPAAIDSVVLDEPLYRNVFPCQNIWRIAEKREIAEGRFP